MRADAETGPRPGNCGSSSAACRSGTRTTPATGRLRYSRYADDHLLGFIGPKAEAEAIKDQLAAFLRDELALELNADKTLITHARTRAARYLGYEITAQHADRKIIAGQRAVNGKIALRVPLDVIRAKRAAYRRHGKPWHRTAMQNLDDYDIVADLRGRIPGHRPVLPARHRRLAVHRAALGRPDLDAEDPGGQAQVLGEEDGGPTPGQDRPHRTGCARATKPGSNATASSRWSPGSAGYPSYATRTRPSPTASRTGFPTHARSWSPGSSRNRCELCGEPGKVLVHQVRNLASLGKPGPAQPRWAAVMARKRRKTLVVCRPCHDLIHHGQPAAAAA